MADQVKVVIYDKDDQYRGQVIPDCTVDLIPNGISVAQFTLDDDHPRSGVLGESGARCGVWFRGAERFRGPVREAPVEGPNGTATFQVESDTRAWATTYGWPTPSSDLAHQTSEYHHISGPSETVFKTAVAANLARINPSWTVAATHGWGQAAVADLRFHPLADKVIDQLTRDQLVVTLAYGAGGAVTVNVRQPATVPGTFTLASGVPDSYKITRTAPTATRAVVAGRGEGTAREFVQVIDTALEAEWGIILEVFVDARNTDVGADLAVEGWAALADGAPKVGVAFELVETKRFRYGTTYIEGDLLAVRIGDVDVVEQITTVSIDQSAGGGVTVAPRVGAVDADDDDMTFRKQIAALARGVRDQGRR